MATDHAPVEIMSSGDTDSSGEFDDSSASETLNRHSGARGSVDSEPDAGYSGGMQNAVDSIPNNDNSSLLMSDYKSMNNMPSVRGLKRTSQDCFSLESDSEVSDSGVSMKSRRMFDYPSSKDGSSLNERGIQSSDSALDISNHDQAEKDQQRPSALDITTAHGSMVRRRTEKVFWNEKSAKMMNKMGFKAGMGLGKEGQGITEPVEASRQRGRRGLGHSIQGLEPAQLEFMFDKEVVSVEETVKWLVNEYEDILEISMDWAVEGERKLTIDDETQFCHAKIVKDIMLHKTMFDDLEGKDMRKAVSRSNPFETTHKGIFLNRAAMKMANMDKILDFMFTDPKDSEGNKMVKRDELLYFADVCAGPGGFSEYVLWRLKWKAKGFGFTLKGENDFKLSEFYAGPCESFEPIYGYSESEGSGNGDIYDPRNQDVLRQYVLKSTDNRGVHFMMADGGFSVEGQENIQEILSKQLYLCQFLVALQIVRTGGHFVCKVFDLFTEFSVGLVYLLYRSFSCISIHKPNSSRPANSERYVICKWKRGNCGFVSDYLFKVNKRLLSFGDGSRRDIVSVVPLSVMEEDSRFMEYIFTSNVEVGRRQIFSLVKVIAFYKDDTLVEEKQTQLRKDCLEYWRVPDDARKAPTKSSPDDAFKTILNTGAPIAPDVIYSKEKVLTFEILKGTFKNPLDWYCSVLSLPSKSTDTLTFFIGLGRSAVFCLREKKWVKVDNLELSAGTLLLGAVVYEFRGESTGQHKTACLHILDAVSLGGIDIRHMHMKESSYLGDFLTCISWSRSHYSLNPYRVQQCHLFAKAMNKPSHNYLSPIHAKELFELRRLSTINERLKDKVMKNSGLQKVFDLHRDNACIIPRGLMFFNGTRDPWVRCWSKSQNLPYYFCCKKNVSFFDPEKPLEACNSFEETYKQRAVFWWDKSPFTIDDILKVVL